MRKTKWYNTWGFRISVIVVVIVIIFFAAKKTNAYINYQEYLKTEIESLKKDNSKLDSLYKLKSAEKEKIKIIREKISIQSEIDRLEHLRNQLLELRKQPPKQIDTISPEELDKYLKELLK
jgi:preprotein translocase subunit SecF